MQKQIVGENVDPRRDDSLESKSESSIDDIEVVLNDDPEDTYNEPCLMVIEDIYGGPIPELISEDLICEPILNVYGPPEPEICSDISVSIGDILIIDDEKIIDDENVYPLELPDLD